MRVRSLGPFARRFLEQHKTARVSAVFARSFHLESGRDAFCIVDALLGDGALNAVLAEPFATLSSFRVGDEARIEHGVITIAGDVLLDARNAIEWRPPLVSMARDSHAAFDALMCSALARAPADGAFRAALDENYAPTSLVERALQSRLRAFIRWLAETPGEVPSVAGLIGLGSGLTPAGDDFLGGAMIAGRMAGRDDQASLIADAIDAQGQGATTLLSAAMLRAAAEGFGGAALHALLAAIGRGDMDGAIRLLDAIDHIGHTSGWDALGGALAMLKAPTRAGDPGV